MRARGTMPPPATLEDLWKGGKPGTLSPLEQVRAVALRDAYTSLNHPVEHGELAELVTLVGGGHPTKQAIQLLLAKGTEATAEGKETEAGSKTAGRPLETAEKNKATVGSFAHRDPTPIFRLATSRKKHKT